MVWILTGVLGGVVTWLVAIRKQFKAYREGMRTLLRGQIWEIHDKAMRDGFLSMRDKQMLQKAYDPYHGIGGNGMGTVMYEEGMDKPTVDDPREQARRRKKKLEELESD